MENYQEAFDLFIALYAKKEFGPTVLPGDFGARYKAAVRAAKESMDGTFSAPLARSIDTLAERVVDVIEQSPAGFFTVSYQGSAKRLMFSQMEAAKIVDERFAKVYPEYRAFHDAFRKEFFPAVIPTVGDEQQSL